MLIGFQFYDYNDDDDDAPADTMSGWLCFSLLQPACQPASSQSLVFPLTTFNECVNISDIELFSL